MKTRIQIFDTLKAIAIIAVIYTHCLQFLGIGNYWHHPLFKLTYSFHMPLFMLISGYFASRSLELPMLELVKKKAIRLLLPCLTAGIIVIGINRLVGVGPKHAGISELVNNLWYLKSLFLCFCIVKLALILKLRMWLTILVSLLIALPIHQYHVNFMLPFFLMGYLWNRHASFIDKYMLPVFIVSLLIYLLLWPMWDGIYTTYATPLKLFRLQSLEWLGFDNLLPYCLRLSIGLAGIGIIIGGIYLLDKFGIRFGGLHEMGKYTLELYSLHFLFINTGVMDACAIPYRCGWYEFGYCLLMTIVLFFICLSLIKYLYRFPILSFLFFGKR